MPLLGTRGIGCDKSFGFTRFTVPAGQQAYTAAGTYTFIPAAGVTSVSVVCVGAGGNSAGSPWSGQSGGGLGYKNNYAVTPGTSYAVVVGAPSAATTGDGGVSYFVSTAVVAGYGGLSTQTAAPASKSGGGYVGDGGGQGGTAYRGYDVQKCPGGGGAGGYSGTGGYGSGVSDGGRDGQVGTGGGGGGGGRGGSNAASGVCSGQTSSSPGGAGGGVGILGQGADGTAGAGSLTSSGSSGGAGSSGSGATYGGGSSGTYQYYYTATDPKGGTYCDVQYPNGPAAGGGAVRIIWAGESGLTRTFPSTNTGNL